MELMSTRRCDILLALNLLMIALLSPSSGEKYILNGEAEDEIIRSDFYPNSYPPDTNVTWEWKVKEGLWGVVFNDFDLDNRNEDLSSYDWLEVGDKHGKVVRYTEDNPPVLHFKSVGPELIVRFFSDGKSQRDTRGFDLYILYGQNERELEIKIHEATKEKREDDDDEFDPMLIIIATALILLILVIIAAVFFLFRKHQHMSQIENRNAFGVRRNSGISHSRRPSTRSRSDGTPPVDGERRQHNGQEGHQQQQQQTQTQREVGRPVQRSNSQLNWMARAELHTTIQTAGRTPKPNIYTPTSVTSALDTRDTLVKNVRNARNQNSETFAQSASAQNNNRNTHDDDVTAVAAAATAAFRRSFSDNNGDTPFSGDLTPCHSMPNNLCIGSNIPRNAPGSSSGNCHSAATANLPAITFSNGSASGQLLDHVTYSRGGNQVIRLPDNRSSLEEYSETVDSLNFSGHRSAMAVSICAPDSKPPSYDEARLSPLPPAYSNKGVTISQACYENVPVSSEGPSTRQWIGSQTNIYINAGSLPTGGSMHSLNRITVDCDNIISPTPAVSQEAISSIIISRSSASQKDARQADPGTPANHKAVHREGGATCESSVKDVDGYAYLIPASSQIKDTPCPVVSLAAPEASNDWRMSQTVPTGLPLDKDTLDSSLDGSYVKMRGCGKSGDEENAYVNLQNE